MAQPEYKGKETSPFQKGLLEIKQKVDNTLEKMKKNPKYIPDRAELDQFSAKALDLIKKHHPEQGTLLTAVIDLTEIPVMAPSMQRVAFETALKEASKNLSESL